MTWIVALMISLYTINLILALFVVFVSRKSASSIWAWLFVIIFVPIIGFIIYLLLGRTLHMKNFVRWNTIHQKQTKEIFDNQQKELLDGSFVYPNDITEKHKDLVKMNLNFNHALLAQHNEVTILADGDEKFKRAIEDILNAKNHVHIQYYIFKMDDVGRSIYDALVQKAKQDVEVKVIYDDLGSRKLRTKDFKELIAAGGEVEAYFSSLFSFINPRMNNRNHRKLIIIDGEIGYIGGFNVGNEYVGVSEKFGYWRDTHLRVVGSAIYGMQAHFIFDWHQARKEQIKQRELHYFPRENMGGSIPIQIISSGPDTVYDAIKKTFIRMISNAKRYAYIQSPYFIPDDSFLEAVMIAASSGVDVRIMTPYKTDHPFVYGGNSAYGGKILEVGGRVFLYQKGFLHSKMIVVDDELVSIGTANIDVRSFSLNFEITALLYDEGKAIESRKLFEADQAESMEVTEEIYEARTLWTKIREGVSRLISPIL